MHYRLSGGVSFPTYRILSPSSIVSLLSPPSPSPSPPPSPQTPSPPSSPPSPQTPSPPPSPPPSPQTPSPPPSSFTVTAFGNGKKFQQALRDNVILRDGEVVLHPASDFEFPTLKPSNEYIDDFLDPIREKYPEHLLLAYVFKGSCMLVMNADGTFRFVLKKNEDEGAFTASDRVNHVLTDDGYHFQHRMLARICKNGTVASPGIPFASTYETLPTEMEAFAREIEIITSLKKRVKKRGPDDRVCVINEVGGGNGNHKTCVGATGIAVLAVLPRQFGFNGDKSNKEHLQELLDQVHLPFKKVVSMNPKKRAMIQKRDESRKQHEAEKKKLAKQKRSMILANINRKSPDMIIDFPSKTSAGPKAAATGDGAKSIKAPPQRKTVASSTKSGIFDPHSELKSPPELVRNLVSQQKAVAGSVVLQRQAAARGSATSSKRKGFDTRDKLELRRQGKAANKKSTNKKSKTKLLVPKKKLYPFRNAIKKTGKDGAWVRNGGWDTVATLIEEKVWKCKEYFKNLATLHMRDLEVLVKEE